MYFQIHIFTPSIVDVNHKNSHLKKFQIKKFENTVIHAIWFSKDLLHMITLDIIKVILYLTCVLLLTVALNYWHLHVLCLILGLELFPHPKVRRGSSPCCVLVFSSSLSKWGWFAPLLSLYFTRIGTYLVGLKGPYIGIWPSNHYNLLGILLVWELTPIAKRVLDPHIVSCGVQLFLCLGLFPSQPGAVMPFSYSTSPSLGWHPSKR